MALPVVEIFVSVNANINPMVSQLTKAESAWTSSAQKMVQVGQDLSKYVTAPLLLMGGVMTKAAADFELGMAKVGGITGATGAQLTALSDLARQVGPSLGMSAIEAADGMKQLAQAGFSAGEMASALPAVMQLAIAGEFDLAKSTELVANTMAGFGLAQQDVGHISAVIARSTMDTTSSIKSMGVALSYVSSVAKSAGLDLEETTAMLGFLHDAGIKGSRAGTTLRRAIADLLDPTNKAKQAFKDMGIEITRTPAGAVDFLNVLQQLRDKGAATGDIIRAFGLIAGPGVVALLNKGKGAIEEYSQVLREDMTSASDLAQRQLDTLWGKVGQLKAAFVELAISIGEAGFVDAAKGVVGEVTKMVKAFDELPAGIKQTVIYFGMAAAAFGPLVLGVGLVVKTIGTFTALILSAEAAVGAYGMSLIAIPQAAALMAAALAGIQVGTFVREISLGKTTVGDLFDSMTSGVQAVTASDAKWHAENQKIHLDQQTMELRAKRVTAAIKEMGPAVVNTAMSVVNAFAPVVLYMNKTRDYATDLTRVISTGLDAAFANLTGRLRDHKKELEETNKAWGEFWMNQMTTSPEFTAEMTALATAVDKALAAGDVAGATAKMEAFKTGWDVSMAYVLESVQKRMPEIRKELKDTSDAAAKMWAPLKDKISVIQPGFKEALTDFRKEFKESAEEHGKLTDKMKEQVTAFALKWKIEPKAAIDLMNESLGDSESKLGKIADAAEEAGDWIQKMVDAMPGSKGGALAVPDWAKDMVDRQNKHGRTDRELREDEIANTADQLGRLATGLEDTVNATTDAQAAHNALTKELGHTADSLVKTDADLLAFSFTTETVANTLGEKVAAMSGALMLTKETFESLAPSVRNIGKMFETVNEAIGKTIGLAFGVGSYMALKAQQESALKLAGTMEHLKNGTSEYDVWLAELMGTVIAAVPPIDLFGNAVADAAQNQLDASSAIDSALNTSAKVVDVFAVSAGLAVDAVSRLAGAVGYAATSAEAAAVKMGLIAPKAATAPVSTGLGTANVFGGQTDPLGAAQFIGKSVTDLVNSQLPAGATPGSSWSRDSMTGGWGGTPVPAPISGVGPEPIAPYVSSPYGAPGATSSVKRFEVNLIVDRAPLKKLMYDIIDEDRLTTFQNPV
jgi:TP901 family phage tail tape measure protein